MADHDEKTVTKDGYELTFYPGFASRCTVRPAEGEEVEMYRQDGPYRLPHGEKKPRDRYRVRLKGGKRKQDLSLDVHDPERRIKRITVELYDENHQVGMGEESDAFDTLSLDNNSIICPPRCE